VFAPIPPPPSAAAASKPPPPPLPFTLHTSVKEFMQLILDEIKSNPSPNFDDARMQALIAVFESEHLQTVEDLSLMSDSNYSLLKVPLGIRLRIKTKLLQLERAGGAPTGASGDTGSGT